MGYAAILVAIVGVGLIASRERRSNVRASILLAIVALPLFALVTSLLLGNARARTRVDVQFLGVRLPLTDMNDCGRPANLTNRSGVWFGGGLGTPVIDPDLIVFPGYRARLIEVCRDLAAGLQAVRIRAVAPGYEFQNADTLNGLRNRTPAEGLITQRTVIRSLQVSNVDRDCLWDGSRTLSQTDLDRLIVPRWLSERAAGMTGWRSYLKTVVWKYPTALASNVYCLDLHGSSAPCRDDYAITRRATFLWLASRSHWYRPATVYWDGLPPAGSGWSACQTAPAKTSDEVAMNLPILDSQDFSRMGASETLPGVSLQMILRHRTSGVADINVPVSASSLQPAAFGLGPQHRFRLAMTADNLVVLADEPSVQVRLDDLFGRDVPELRQGEFDVLFGGVAGGNHAGLLVDLGSSADRQRPKPILRNSSVRMRIRSDDAKDFEVTTAGGAPAVHTTDNALWLPVQTESGRAIQPLIAVRKVSVPSGFVVAPLFATFMFCLAILVASHLGDPLDERWILAAIVFCLVTMRFVLTTRMLMVEPSSSEQVVRWIVSGTYLFLIPPALLTSFSIQTLRSTPESQLPFSLRSAARTAVTASLGLAWPLLAAFVCLGWCAFAVALTVGERWLIFKGVVGRLTGEVLLVVFVVAVSRRLAGLTARVLKVRVARRSASQASALFRLARPSGVGSQSVHQRPSLWRSSFLVLAVTTTAVFFRFVCLLMGWQESVLSVKLDVFYLPWAAAVFAALSQMQVSERFKLFAILVFLVGAFGIGGWMLNDVGLLWVGGMATVLVLPWIGSNPRELLNTCAAAMLFLALFMSPKLAPWAFQLALEYRGGEKTIAVNGGTVDVPDPLQVRRDRDHYRMLDAVVPEFVEKIPSQLAREVAVERERLRYQALNGAWREGFRAPEGNHSSLHGAGMLQARPIVGEPTFLEAARSDYVYPMYIRSEYGTVGLLGVLGLYLGLLACALTVWMRDRSRGALGAWSIALGVGSAVFMLGATNGLFPFSGKWPLFLALGSGSDICLGTILVALCCTTRSS